MQLCSSSVNNEIKYYFHIHFNLSSLNFISFEKVKLISRYNEYQHLLCVSNMPFVEVRDP